MWIYMLLLFANLSSAYMGQTIDVIDYQYEVGDSSPPCSILKHRKENRDKVIREMLHQMEVRPDEDFEKVMLSNFLMTNKFFLEKKIWQDESINVMLEAEVSDPLKETIAKQGLANIFFSVKGQGIIWNSHVKQFPGDIILEYNEKDNRLTMTYQIYLYEICKDELEPIQLSWLPNKLE